MIDSVKKLYQVFLGDTTIRSIECYITPSNFIVINLKWILNKWQEKSSKSISLFPISNVNIWKKYEK